MRRVPNERIETDWALSMLRKAKRVVAAVEGDKLRLEHDIAPDLETVGSRCCLHASEANCWRLSASTTSIHDAKP